MTLGSGISLKRRDLWYELGTRKGGVSPISGQWLTPRGDCHEYAPVLIEDGADHWWVTCLACDAELMTVPNDPWRGVEVTACIDCGVRWPAFLLRDGRCSGAAIIAWMASS